MDEALPSELETSTPVTSSSAEAPTTVGDNLAEAQARPWRYFVAGMELVLLAVLGFLARPALDSAAFLAASPAKPIEAAAPVVETPVAAASTAKAPAHSIVDIVRSGGHSQGSSEAPVVIVEYSDFQCPYCGRHFREVEGRLKEMYVKNGQVRLVYKYLTILGDESVWAALASECAADQNKFWEYHDLIFSRQNGENQGAFNPDNLKSRAAELGLDTVAFNECLDSQKYLDVVQANTLEAKQLGI